MSDAISLVELLNRVSGAQLEFRREDDLLAVAVLTLPGSRQVLVIERTYRGGIRVLLDPTPEEVEIARIGALWQIWNSERSSLLTSAD
jgi:hypothetical protein